MFLKDQLKDTYHKASLEKNNFVLENVINRWAHRFGVESMNELIVINQEQINLIEEDQGEENQKQINLTEEDQGEENQEQINLIEEDQGEENQKQINLIEEDQGEENQEQINLIEEDQGEENQEQINLIEEDQGEENQEQINLIEEENQEENNLELFENIQYKKHTDFKSKGEKITNNPEIINKDIYESSEDKYIELEELPLPNINNLRKWIKNDKKAS